MDRFHYAADPDAPGWMIWELWERGRYNDFLSPLRVRFEGDRRARCRMWPRAQHSNLSGFVHGGVILGFIDVALFAGARACGSEGAATAVTLDCSTQFLAPGRVDEPLDAVIELLREGSRLLFLRGVLEQGDDVIASFTGALSKVTPRG